MYEIMRKWKYKRSINIDHRVNIRCITMFISCQRAFWMMTDILIIAEFMFRWKNINYVPACQKKLEKIIWCLLFLLQNCQRQSKYMYFSKQKYLLTNNYKHYQSYEDKFTEINHCSLFLDEWTNKIYKLSFKNLHS